MAVSKLEIARREPYAHGYERLDGKMRFAVDPADPANAMIVDLDKAAREADGKVHFSADFTLLQPADEARSNRRLLFYVVNRGQRASVPLCRGVARLATEPPTDEIDPGDGFLLKRGW